jgi:predicted P-loop ATPase
MYCNIITWAEQPTDAEQKIKTYLATFNWRLIEADKIELADQDKDYGDEFNELLGQAAENPKAIILGRFYSYKAM